MSEHLEREWSTGRLVRCPAQQGKPIEVDCSGWEADVPAERWSTGRLVRVCQGLPLSSGPFVPAPETRLEIAVQLAPEAAPERVFLFATRMIAAVQGAAPTLRLRYDTERSRAEPGKVVIALTPEDSGAAKQEMAVIADAVRSVVAEFPQAKLDEVRLKPAA
jgi:hypothetical protein